MKAYTYISMHNMHIYIYIYIYILIYIYIGSVPDKIPIISERVKHRISICIDLYI
jgi:hypothetical protein